MPSSGLHLYQPSDDARTRKKVLLQTDSIISFAIAHAIYEYPERVQKDLIRFMQRVVELVDENRELRHRLAQRPGGIV